jgi:16S rRNA processing protein RimM
VSEFVAVGRIGPVIGVKGEVFVEPWTEQVEDRFAEGAVLATEPADRGPLTVLAIRQHRGRLVVSFAGIEDRDAAGALHHVQVLVAASARPPLEDPDDFYDTDLIGLAAVTVAGRSLGPVSDVVHAPAGDYLVVLVDGRECLVPFVRAIVPVIDLPAGRITLDPPDGLLEL